MTGYVDIHAHVLPGIDDGPPDLAGALALVRAAADSGVAVIAATPHLRSDFPDVHVDELADRCQELREAIQREGIDVEVVCGAEVSLTWALEATDEELRLASYGQQGRDLLIETPYTNVVGLDQVVYELRLKGYRITLAHPERNPEFHQHESMLRELVEQGVLLQINAESLLGPRGPSGPRRFARELCRTGAAHVLASDGHRADRWRPVTRLAEAVPAATEVVGADRATWMAQTTGSSIVRGTELPAAPPVLAGRRGWRLFGRA